MAAGSQFDPIRRLAAIACFSSAVLLTEITLTQIFSVALMYHYAYLVLSIALFGPGASGIFHFATDVLGKREEWLTLLPMIAGVGLLVSVGIILRIPFSPQLLTAGNFGNLVALILMTAILFLAGLLDWRDFDGNRLSGRVAEWLGVGPGIDRHHSERNGSRVLVGHLDCGGPLGRRRYGLTTIGCGGRPRHKTRTRPQWMRAGHGRRMTSR